MPQAAQLEKQLIAAVRAELGRKVEVVPKKSYRRLVKGKATLAYITASSRGAKVGVHVRDGSGYRKLDVTTEDEIGTAVAAIRESMEARAA